MPVVLDVSQWATGSLGQYVGQLAQHLDQLTRNQSGSVAALMEHMAALSNRLEQVAAANADGSRSLGERLDQAAAVSAEATGSLGQYVGQLAQHMDQLTRNQLLSIEMQRTADSHSHAAGQSQENLAAEVRSRLLASEARLEELMQVQSRLSEQLDGLARQGLGPRIKRLFGR
jgi:cation transport regulator ChaC